MIVNLKIGIVIISKQRESCKGMRIWSNYLHQQYHVQQFQNYRYAKNGRKLKLILQIKPKYLQLQTFQDFQVIRTFRPMRRANHACQTVVICGPIREGLVWKERERRRILADKGTLNIQDSARILINDIKWQGLINILSRLSHSAVQCNE